MKLLRRLAVCAVAIGGAAALALQPASADPLKMRQGTANLSVSGLIVDLAPVAGQEYQISGNWIVNEAGDVFDSQDVVDQFDIATNTLVAGTWVSSGYFNAGACGDVIAGEALDSAWTLDATIDGVAWKVRGGIYAFNNGLGRRPAALLCRTNEAGRSILLYHFLAQQPEAIHQADVVDALNKSGVIAAVSRSFSSGRVGDFAPVHRPEVKQLGTVAAARTIKLDMSGLSLTLPDDGYFWMASKDETSGVDRLTRYLPSLPDVDTDVILAEAMPCKDVIASITGDLLPDHTPTNLPPGWTPTPGMKFNGGVELGACYDREEGGMIFGVFQGSDKRDVAYLRPLMDALVAAKSVD